MRIAYFTLIHLEACKDLFLNFYNNDLNKCEFTKEKADSYLTELINAPRFVGFLLLDHEDKLVGAALCRERTWWDRDELHIDEFLLDIQNENAKHGTKILKYMNRYVKERNLSGTTLITNNNAMAAFYQKAGFKDHEIYFMYRGA